MNAYTLLLSKNLDRAWKKAERPDPAPRAGEVLIRVRAVSLNYRDVMIARGQYMRPLKEAIIPCSDGAGEVTACGPGVTHFKPGDRVMGSFFQDWIIRADPSRLPRFRSGRLRQRHARGTSRLA